MLVAKGYWIMTWLGLIANITALPIIGFLAFAGPPLETANISLAFSLAWPASIVGIVASAGLLAERKWGVILAIISLSMAISASLPYGIIRFILIRNSQNVSIFSVVLASMNLLALIYWCKPIHRRTKRL